MDNLVLKGLTEVEGMRFHDIEGGEKHMSKKYEVADCLTLENAESIHEVGVALVITDGKYAQIVKEDDEN